MSGEDRRLQLIEVAIDLFSRKGFAGTTTREIAGAAGVTEAIIFRHFSTKEDFYKAILDRKCSVAGTDEWMAGAQAFMDANDDAGLFRFLISKIVAMYRDEPQLERLLLHAALEGHELAMMHHTQFALPIGERFKDYLQRRQKAGAIRECDPGILLFALAGIPQFYAMHRYIHKHAPMPWSDEQVIDTFLAILMDGLHGANAGKSRASKKSKQQ